MKRAIILLTALIPMLASAQFFTCDTVQVQFTDSASGFTVYFTDNSIVPPPMVVEERHWNFGDPESGANDTSVAPQPVHTFPATGVYTVCLASRVKYPGINPGEEIICYDTSCRSIGVVPSGIIDWNEEFLTLYPNPSRGTFRINGYKGAIEQAIIYDEAGQKLSEQAVVNYTIKIPEDYRPGIYFVHFKVPDGTLITRAMLVH